MADCSRCQFWREVHRQRRYANACYLICLSTELVSEANENDIAVAKLEDITDRMLALLAQIPSVEKSNPEHVKCLPKVRENVFSIWDKNLLITSTQKKIRLRHLYHTFLFKILHWYIEYEALDLNLHKYKI